MIATKAYATQGASEALIPWNFERREPGKKDVLIDILYCGVCHSDIHQARNEWGHSIYPMVPGHEIVGRVAKVGSDVKKVKTGDLVGVGCMVDSCGNCEYCKQGEEQFCADSVMTYSDYEKDRKTITQGGYSNRIVVDEHFVLHVSERLVPLHAVAPLLCAGITTYSPLKKWKVGKGHKVGVVGLGGLGHMAVKFAASFGAEVTVLSTSPKKEADAKRLGADHFVLTTDKEKARSLKGHFDFIVDTVSALHDYGQYLGYLVPHGVLICVGLPSNPISLNMGGLVINNHTMSGSNIGGIRETQEMLDYCAEHKIVCDVEVINIRQINEAYERMLKGDVHYRFVIDMDTL